MRQEGTVTIETPGAENRLISWSIETLPSGQAVAKFKLVNVEGDRYFVADDFNNGWLFDLRCLQQLIQEVDEVEGALCDFAVGLRDLRKEWSQRLAQAEQLELPLEESA